MTNLSSESAAQTTDRRHFDATLSLDLTPMAPASVARALFGSPMMVLKTLLLIYAHALVLLVRQAPFFSHPKGSPS